jgi:hypothetical protein
MLCAYPALGSPMGKRSVPIGEPFHSAGKLADTITNEGALAPSLLPRNHFQGINNLFYNRYIFR